MRSEKLWWSYTSANECQDASSSHASVNLALFDTTPIIAPRHDTTILLREYVCLEVGPRPLHDYIRIPVTQHHLLRRILTAIAELLCVVFASNTLGDFPRSLRLGDFPRHAVSAISRGAPIFRGISSPRGGGCRTRTVCEDLHDICTSNRRAQMGFRFCCRAGGDAVRCWPGTQ